MSSGSPYVPDSYLFSPAQSAPHISVVQKGRKINGISKTAQEVGFQSGLTQNQSCLNTFKERLRSAQHRLDDGFLSERVPGP